MGREGKSRNYRGVSDWTLIFVRYVATVGWGKLGYAGRVWLLAFARTNSGGQAISMLAVMVMSKGEDY